MKNILEKINEPVPFVPPEQLPPNTKLVNVTWKENSLWLVTRPMRAEEQPETYEFKESVIFGLLEGKIVIKETR